MGKSLPITPRVIEHVVHNANPANATIARASTVPKRSSNPVPVHGGMTRQQQVMAGVGGLGHAVSINEVPNAASCNPLDPTTPGKVLAPVKLAWGSKGGTDAHLALGKAIMDEALRGAPPDHPAKLGRRL